MSVFVSDCPSVYLPIVVYKYVSVSVHSAARSPYTFVCQTISLSVGLCVYQISRYSSVSYPF